MEHKSLVSSNLASAAYDPATGILEVAFKNGGLYQYTGVPEMIYKGLITATSAGSFFSAYIRNEFPARKLG